MTIQAFPTDPKIDALIERFPRLFKGAQPLVWSDLPQGWAELTDRLFADIDRILDDTAAKAFQVLQIKEKFGGLRVSWRFAKEETAAIDQEDTGLVEPPVQKPVEPTPLVAGIRARVEQARKEADTTCQQCGNGSAKANNSGYIVTLCKPCRTRADLREQGR